MISMVFALSLALLQGRCFTRGQCIISRQESRQPLLLTPLLQTQGEDQVKKARDAARVHPFAGDVRSYSGYFTANETRDSNLFFWFFESEERSAQTAPLLLWLHGGPGQSSLMTLFAENGPWRIANGAVVLAEYSWTKRHHVLYIDNPVGTGYSYTRSADANSSSLFEDAASDLYESLVQFFKLFPEYAKNAFFLTGQSYAGRYIPKLATLIRQKNNDKDVVAPKINLRGLFIGAGLVDPANQAHFADYFYELGVLDSDERTLMAGHEQKAREALEKGDFERGQSHLNETRSKLVSAGYREPFVDVRRPRYNFSDYDQVVAFLRAEDTRKAIHVGSQQFRDTRQNCWHSRADHLSSVGEELAEALKYHKVLLYSGQFDMVVPPVQIERLIESLSSWDGCNAFKKWVVYRKWYAQGKLAGFAKAYKNLIQVMVRRANHFIIPSQPEYMLDLISWYTRTNS